jgi:pimeloyl-ACP methyl ester carboxylesterase
MCSLARPDIFKSLVLMSHPVKGPFTLPFGTSPSSGQPSKNTEEKPSGGVHEELAKLQPPRKHYQRYYCTSNANGEMTYPGGAALRTFLRGYFHLKSADWDGNTPHRLDEGSATQLARMPHYYIMPADKTMREAVADEMTQKEIALAQKVAGRWLSDEELGFYAEEWSRTTFLGGLNWYCLTVKPDLLADAQIWSGRKISVPTVFVAGTRDWGSFQDPGALEALEDGRFVEDGKYLGTVLVDGAGHWVNQEQPATCAREILRMAGVAGEV